MTRRKVMAARLGPASRISGSRSVYVHVPDSIGPHHPELIDAVLKKVVRYEDRLLYPDTIAGAAPVITFAGHHGLYADPLSGETTAPDLVIEIVDPRADNSQSSLAALLAEQQSADLIITELPVILA
jgi:hypothetical protein